MIAGLGPELLWLALGVFLLAGIIKGLIGIGLPTAAVGILSQVIDPRVAIALMVFPSLISNAWQVWRMGGLAGALRRYWVFLVMLCGMILAWSVLVTGSVPTETLMLVLGCVICKRPVKSLSVYGPKGSVPYCMPAACQDGLEIDRDVVGLSHHDGSFMLSGWSKWLEQFPSFLHAQVHASRFL